jgi:hypothetical protein
MPRYYLHFTDGRRDCPDAEGLELPNDAAARKEGRLAARDLASEPAESAWTVQVIDEAGRPVAKLTATPPWKVLTLARVLDNWLKRMCGHPDALSSPPPSPADRAPIDPLGRLPEKIWRGHGADLRETSDKA